MTVAYKALGQYGAQYTSSGSGSLRLYYPATGVTANDIAFAAVWANSSLGSWATPSGWTQLTYVNKYAWFWKRLAGTESGGSQIFSFSYPSHSGIYGVMITFSGCITTGSPWDQAAIKNTGASSATVTIPDLTSDTGGPYRFIVNHVMSSSSAANGNDDATNYSEFYEDATIRNWLGYGYELVSAGKPGADSYTLDLAPTEWQGVTCPLIPASYPSGFGNAVNGVSAGNIAKINGVAVADIAKVNGVS